MDASSLGAWARKELTACGVHVIPTCSEDVKEIGANMRENDQEAVRTFKSKPLTAALSCYAHSLECWTLVSNDTGRRLGIISVGGAINYRGVDYPQAWVFGTPELDEYMTRSPRKTLAVSRKIADYLTGRYGVLMGVVPKCLLKNRIPLLKHVGATFEAFGKYALFAIGGE